MGISQNKLKDRWRLSPAYDSELKSLNRKELFHSQCWPRMCSEHHEESPDTFTISVIHESKLKDFMGERGIEIDQSLIGMETWFIRSLGDQLWNKKS